MDQDWYNPTVKAVSPFDPKVDADVLYKAIKGLENYEKTFIKTLCNRTSLQRIAICQAYFSAYGKNLDSELINEFSDNFEKLMMALCLPKADLMAREIYEAVSGIGTCEGTLVEILCSGKNPEIRDLNAAYLRLYGRPMETDIKGDTSGNFRTLLVSLAQGLRDENKTIDIQTAKYDAICLYKAGKAKLGTDESTFNTILTNRNWAHLRQVMVEYKTMHGHSLKKAIKSEFFADTKRGLLGILQCAKNRPGYFARQLYNTLKGTGPKDCSLIRIIVSRCDVDLGNIKREYEKKFSRNLIYDISEETSGDYKKALLALLG